MTTRKGIPCALGLALGALLQMSFVDRAQATEAAATAAADDPSLCSRVDAAIRKVR